MTPERLAEIETTITECRAYTLPVFHQAAEELLAEVSRLRAELEELQDDIDVRNGERSLRDD